jgi:hypothetical protein
MPTGAPKQLQVVRLIVPDPSVGDRSWEGF